MLADVKDRTVVAGQEDVVKGQPDPYRFPVLEQEDLLPS